MRLPAPLPISMIDLDYDYSDVRFRDLVTYTLIGIDLAAFQIAFWEYIFRNFS